jgi:magnesium transporter
MRKLFQRESEKAGLVPGALVHVGEASTAPVRITVMDYGAERVDEREVASVEECLPYRSSSTVTWINVDGVHRPEIIEAFGQHFGLHALLLEDVMHTEQRPKAEDFGDHLYLVLRMLYDPDETDDVCEVDSEQVSIVLGPTWVLTFQESEGHIFDPVRMRIRQARGRIRKMGADYLAYALMDMIVDKYFAVLEEFGDYLETLEEALLENPTQNTLAEIRDIKRAIIHVRRAVWPLRDVLSVLLRGEAKLFKKPTLMFLRDLYDHTIRVVDVVETLRELTGGMLDIYMSSVSNRMNEVMKVLTIVATVFIPLTFIAGIYGMNFDTMPELHWAYGYWYVWALMLAVGLVMLVYFRGKKWL